jgi:two-component system OmpR family sensor kinase
MNRVCEAQARQRRFVADAAHELRTPIAALSLQADNLAATLTDPAQTGERVQVLQEGLVRTKALLEQLLSLSRLQGHSPDVPYGGCDVLEVLREVVADLMPLASDRQVDLGVIEAQPCSLACHPFELKALLGNVLGNAIQHGRPSGQVDVTLRCDGLRVHLLVDDDGPGLAPEHTVRVFSPFYKAGDSTGTGLGLAIVKAMADKLQAHVSLGTRPDGHAGCRFSLNAPQHLPD